MSQTPKTNRPALDEAISSAAALLGISLPPEYVAWLKESNGARGAIGRDNYVDLWNVEELGPRNEMYKVSTFAPGLLLFGTDGGNEGFGYDLRSSSPTIVAIPLTGMSWKDAKFQGRTFPEFWQSLETD